MEEKIRRFIEDSYLVEFSTDINDETNLFQEKIVDSFGFVELVTFLEREFQIKISDQEILSDRLTSYSQIVALVREKLGEQNS